MKKRQILIVVIVLMFLSSFNTALGADVVYLVSNTINIKQVFIDILEDEGFTVSVVEDGDIDDIDFSEYDFMLINNDQFRNYNSIPVNEYPALIVNKFYMDDWHWASYISQKAASQPLKAHVNDPHHFITYGFPGKVQIYTKSIDDGVDTPVYYLHRWAKASQLTTVVSTDNNTIYNTYNAIIATAKPGTKLKDGYYSNTKSVFFGIIETNFWTSETEQLFRNSALWLITDTTSPKISNILVADITNTSATIMWDTDDESNSTFNYGTTTGLGNIIKDSNYVQNHVIYLAGLEEKKKYYYNIMACNDDGYCSITEVSSFSTKDLTAPNSLSVLITDITNSSVDISVETDEEAYSRIYYGSISLDHKTSASGLSYQEDFYIGGLKEKTTYSYLVEVCDQYYNCKNSSLYEFTTLDFTPPNKPKDLILEVMNFGSSVKVEWDAPDGEEAAKYNIYISNSHSLDDFDFENPSTSTALTEYIDNSASAVQQRYYIVRAEDAAGNEEGNTDIVGKFDLGLNKGYNLIAFPLIPFDSGVSKVMHQDASYNPVSEIWRYDAMNQEFETVAYNSLTNEWDTSEFDELITLEGYFLRSNQDIEFTIVGYPPLLVDIELKEGLNLYGLSLFDDKQIEDVVRQLPSGYNVTYVAFRNGESYDIATYYPSEDVWFVDDFDIYSGVGYWVKANKDFGLTVE